VTARNLVMSFGMGVIRMNTVFFHFMVLVHCRLKKVDKFLRLCEIYFIQE